MRYLAPRSRSLVSALIAVLIALFAHATLAQSQAIEPCPAASPAPQVGAAPAAVKVNAKVSQTAIDATIPDDPALQKIIGAYSPKVRELSIVIGTLEGELKKSGVGAASLGNFVTNAMMSQARAKGRPAVVAITNAGGLRKNTIAAGQLRASDVFELLPFENALVEVELTGAQLLKLLDSVTRGRDAQSGARIQFRWNDQDRPEFIGAKLIGPNGTERDIDPAATYSIVTIDYLLKLASGNYALLQEAKSTTPLNTTIRDAVMEYVKAETKAGRPIRATIDDRFVQIGPGPSRAPSSPND
ncbi:MAG TPA: 5'-nucleotidase C-terminal domain-containing protein [Pyrinomonadaceae bacterium]|nr:5'-nucleotidase C-terminal domain-containing protein [Pyrinomonadaceae bacterium]